MKTVFGNYYDINAENKGLPSTRCRKAPECDKRRMSAAREIEIRREKSELKKPTEI